jgi:vacuolar-type H+-ATPase subunit H
MNRDEQEALIILQKLGIIDSTDLHTVQLLNISGQIEQLQERLDEHIRAKVWGAFESIKIAAISNEAETKRLSLEKAHSLLTDCIGHKNKNEIVASAHFGLAYLSAVRNDRKIAGYHLLQAFVIDTRLTRKQLAPELYEKMFKPLCRGAIEHSQQRLDRASRRIKEWRKETRDEYGPAAELMMGDKDKAVRKKQREIRHDLEKEIDQICHGKALELLSAIGA